MDVCVVCAAGEVRGEFPVLPARARPLYAASASAPLGTHPILFLVPFLLIFIIVDHCPTPPLISPLLSSRRTHLSSSASASVQSPRIAVDTCQNFECSSCSRGALLPQETEASAGAQRRERCCLLIFTVLERSGGTRELRLERL